MVQLQVRKYWSIWLIPFCSSKAIRHYAYRILRTIKNRFGSASELGIYEMTNDGMRGVNNPSEILITQKEEQLSGIAIAASMEGMRPLLIEVQALGYTICLRNSAAYSFRIRFKKITIVTGCARKKRTVFILE